MTLRMTARYGILALVAPIGLVGAMGTSAHAADAPTCDGKAATIVVPAGAYETDPVTGTPGDDVIVGTRGVDTIDGAGGDDTICGFAGADTLTGGEGDDRLFGGLDMEYDIDDGYVGDLLIPGPGDDYVDLGSDPAARDACTCASPFDYDQVSYADAAGAVDVDLRAGTATGQGNDTIVVPDISGGIVGSAHDDHLVGSSGHDTIAGGGGDDTIDAGDGNDSVEPDSLGRSTAFVAPELEGAPGDDTVDAGRGDDSVRSTLGRDVIDGGPGKDTLWARTDSPGGSLTGGPGKDVLDADAGISLLGGRGQDSLRTRLDPEGSTTRIDGGPGRDVVSLTRLTKGPSQKVLVHVPRQAIRFDGRLTADYRRNEKLVIAVTQGLLTFVGGKGSDELRVTSMKAVRAFGGRGNDTLGGGNRRDLLVGGPGHDVLRARDGRDRAFGGPGNDRIFGGSGNDLLDGSPGRDQLTGGSGRDRCLRGERLRGCEVRR